MGKITMQKSDRMETPKPKRKRRKRDLDKIHKKILKARKKLDNVGKNANKDGQEKQDSTKICSRLLPRPTIGIYRNGAKGKNIRKAKTLENIFNKARLESDALKLFNGDTPESKYTMEDVVHDSTKQLPNKKLVKNSLEWTPCTLEQSPILGKEQGRNRKLCIIKKKIEESFLENSDPNKTMEQNTKNESKYIIQKEDICKRRLFQNDKEHLETFINPQMQIYDNVDIPKENKIDEKSVQVSSNNVNTSWAPLNRYKELCMVISAENSKTDFLPNYQIDPFITKVKELRQVFADSFRRRFWRKIGQGVPDSVALSTETQACSYSDNLQLSSTEFEVPQCDENHINITNLQQDIFQNDNFHTNSVQNTKVKENEDIIYYNSTSGSSCNNTSAVCSTSKVNVENHKSNNKQHIEETSNSHQLLPVKPLPTNFYFVNEKESTSQKNLNLDINNSLKNNIYVNIPNYTNTRHLDKLKDNNALIFSCNSMLPAEKYSSKGHEKLPIKPSNIYKQTTISDSCVSNDSFRESIDRTANRSNMKNIKRIPTILRRCGNDGISKINRHLQATDNYTEDLYKKPKRNLFNNTSNNNEIAFQASFENFPSCSMVNESFNRSKMLKSQISSIEIKDSQESQLKTQWNVNQRSNESNERNKSNCLNNFLHPHIFGFSHNANAYTENVVQQQEVALDMSKHHFLSDDNRQIYFINTSLPNFNIEPAKQLSRQTKPQNDLHRHICEGNNIGQELFATTSRCQNQNILFKGVEDRAIPTFTLSYPHSIQDDKKSGVPAEETLDKADSKYVKIQTGQNACRCNALYTINCSHKCNPSHVGRFNKESVRAEVETSCNMERYNSVPNNNVNLLDGAQNIQLLSLERKYHPCTYSRVTDNQHRAVDTVILQDIAQPVKYVAVKNGVNIQRIPVYINNGNVEVTKSVPLKVVTRESNNRAKTFPQNITTRITPLQTNAQFDDFTTHKKNNPTFVRHLNPLNTILFNSDLQSNTWYASNL